VQARAVDSERSTLQIENTYLKSSIEDLKSQMSEIANLLRQQQTSGGAQNDDKVQETIVDSDEESLQSKRARRCKNKTTAKDASTVSLNEPNNLDVQSQHQTSILGRLFGRKETAETAPSITRESEITENDFSDLASNRSLPCSRDFNDLKVTQKYWITKVELELLSSPLDQGPI